MSNSKLAILILALSVGPFAAITHAEPGPGSLNFCAKLSGSISSGVVAPRQAKVIHGPYTVKCGTTKHHFNVRGTSGQVPVIIQQLRNGNWSAVTGRTYNPSGQFGAGTFRLVLDNVQGQTSVSYTGSYTIPM